MAGHGQAVRHSFKDGGGLAAALVARWHDRTARSGRLRAGIAAVTVLGVVSLALAITTGAEDNVSSDPIPSKIEK